MKQTDPKRTIRWRSTKRLGDQVEITGGLESVSAPTDHSHPNKTFLDTLNVDANGRLTKSGQIINVPLLDEQW
jgi:hypothetical protein